MAIKAMTVARMISRAICVLVGGTSMGRKKGSWLTCTKVLHLSVETAECIKRTIAIYPNMLILQSINQRENELAQFQSNPLYPFLHFFTNLLVRQVGGDITNLCNLLVLFIFMIGNRKKDVLGDYDFSRTDKFYLLKIPTHLIEEGVVLYEMHLKDLTNCETYVCRYRFKELKNVHESLEKFDFQLPPFPKTHFWQKTNSNPELIEKRRIGLEAYFSKVINDPYLRGYPQVKKIIRMCKKGSETKRRMSNMKTEDSTEIPRSFTFDKASVDIIPKQEWQKLRRKNTMLM